MMRVDVTEKPLALPPNVVNQLASPSGIRPNAKVIGSYSCSANLENKSVSDLLLTVTASFFVLISCCRKRSTITLHY